VGRADWLLPHLCQGIDSGGQEGWLRGHVDEAAVVRSRHMEHVSDDGWGEQDEIQKE